MAQPPERVMRFYGNNDYAMEVLGFHEIAFVNTTLFNDPFDPLMGFLTTPDIDFNKLMVYIHHNKSEEDYRRFMRDMSRKRWESFIETSKESFEELRRQYFMFCTNGIDDQDHPRGDLYLWGHYGNGHRGIAIEFDVNALLGSIQRHIQIGAPKSKIYRGELIKIIYREELPAFTLEDCFGLIRYHFQENRSNENLRGEVDRLLGIKLGEMFVSKSREWYREREWRLILKNDETKMKIVKCQLMPETVKAVYLGCRIDEKEQAAAVYETQRNFPTAKIFKGELAGARFALGFEEIR